MEERVMEIIKVQLGAKEPAWDDSLVVDLGMDSLGKVEMVFWFEEEFGIDIQDEEINKCITVQDVIDLVKTKTEA
jgi:acyl carrier protein